MRYSCMSYAHASKNDFFSSGKFGKYYDDSISFNLLQRNSFHKVCHLLKTYLLIKVLKLLKGILNKNIKMSSYKSSKNIQK